MTEIESNRPSGLLARIQSLQRQLDAITEVDSAPIGVEDKRPVNLLTVMPAYLFYAPHRSQPARELPHRVVLKSALLRRLSTQMKFVLNR